MRISSKSLTEAAGFIEGATIELILESPEIPGGVGSFLVVFRREDFPKEESFLEAVSIKLLTGPMSIWCYAPTWAEAVHITDESILWLDSKDDYLITADPERCSLRPWWCTKQ